MRAHAAVLRLSLFSLLGLSCASASDRLPVEPPPVVVVVLPAPDAHPVGWPYWTAVSVARTNGLGSRPPKDPNALGRVRDDALWKSREPAIREQILAQGFAIVPGARTSSSTSIGDFYLTQLCGGTPSVVTIDALVAVTFLVVEAALADAEARVALPSMRTLLARLDARLIAAARGAHPDLGRGLALAEGVVAVGRSLMDPSYVAPEEVRSVVGAELELVRAHARPSQSPLLDTTLDYTAFTRRGAVSEATLGPYLAAQWLAAASFAFAVDESTSRVDMSAARARARAALLLARLFVPSDADPVARESAFELERLGELAFGDASGTSPSALAKDALAHGFDPHDARAIADPAKLDRIRRAEAKALGSMEIVPLRRIADGAVWNDRAGARAASDLGRRDPQTRDVARWLLSAEWEAAMPRHHSSFYASGLDALATWEAPSPSESTLVASEAAAWQERRVRGALAGWALLRHSTVPFARIVAHSAETRDRARECARAQPTPLVVVEPHPEAIAALLGLARQVGAGLTALGAIEGKSESQDLLRDVEALLEEALAAAADERNEEASSRALLEIPERMATIEARLAPAAGPFVASVLSEVAHRRMLLAGIGGTDTLYLIVRDPRTGQPVVVAGALLAGTEDWAPSNVDATDEAWGNRLFGKRSATDVADPPLALLPRTLEVR